MARQPADGEGRVPGHFIDLCRMLGQPTPNEDPTGESYAFEKGAGKSTGGEGWADVWKRGFFAREYKGRKKNLRAAYTQLEGYREALDNPPLLVVSDLNVIEIHTNFTNTAAETFSFDLDDLARHPAEPLRLLRALFTDPFALSPHTSPEVLTRKAAESFAALASALRDRGMSRSRAGGCGRGGWMSNSLGGSWPDRCSRAGACSRSTRRGDTILT